MESEVKSFNKNQKLSRVLSAISMCLTPILALYDYCMCNCDSDFYSISFVIPIYKIISNLVLIIILSKKKIKYECQELQINMNYDILNDNIYKLKNLNKLMAIITLPLSAVCLLVLIYYHRKMKNKSPVEPDSTAIVPITPVQPGMQPGMQPRMQPGIQHIVQNGMQPGIQPTMQNGMQPGIQPIMQNGMKLIMLPGMEPGILPGIHNEMQKTIQPGMQPGMISSTIPESKTKIKRHKNFNKKLKTIDSNSEMV